MDTQKRNHEEHESDLITFMRLGSISILDALVVKLPDVFTAVILAKLDIKDTLNLAQVNKTYNAAVWSVGGVRSLEAKLKAHMERSGEDRAIEPMIQAASHGNVPAVRALLESGVDVNETLYSLNFYSYPTALHLAAIYGHVATVQILIEKGADPNIKEKSSFGDTGRTPLSIAAEQGNSWCVMELVEAGANVNLASSSGDTPLMYAVRKGHEAIVALLIGYKADVHLVNDDGETALTIVEKTLSRVEREEKMATRSIDDVLNGSRNPITAHVEFKTLRANLEGVFALLMGTDRRRHYNPIAGWAYPKQCHHL